MSTLYNGEMFEEHLKVSLDELMRICDMSATANPGWFASAMNKAFCNVCQVNEINEKKPAGEKEPFDKAIEYYQESIRSIEHEIAFWMVFRAQLDSDKSMRNKATIASIDARVQLLMKICEGMLRLIH